MHDTSKRFRRRASVFLDIGGEKSTLWIQRYGFLSPVIAKCLVLIAIITRSFLFDSIQSKHRLKRRDLYLSLSLYHNRKRLISSNSLRKEIQSRVSLSIPLSKFLGFRVQRHPRVHRTREEAATIPPPFLFPGDDEVARRRRGDISRLKSRTTKDRLC